MPDGRSAADDTLSALARAKLRPAERRVAAVVGERRAEVPRMSIAELAAAAGVSEPTVHRFCRAIGCAGFPEFKLRLAEGLASGTPYVHRDVAVGDPFGVVVEKIFDSSQRALADLRGSLNRAAVERALALLRGAKRIECCGGGLGVAMALDLQLKLMRLGVPAVWNPDTHTQAMAAAVLRPGDVVVILSVHGGSWELVRIARTARESGASVIAVARSGAPIAALADVFIAVDTAEDTEIYTPSQSRLAVLLVVDVLTTALTSGMGPGVVERLRRVKPAVQLAPAATCRGTGVRGRR
jgi:RpiR family carbohydrate utilization transcriptional regulator